VTPVPMRARPRAHRRRAKGRLRAALLALAAAVPCAPAMADRPFLATTGAAAEEDDDGVWSLESWFQRVGPRRSVSVAPEYAFSPVTSMQFELTRQRDRAAGETTQQAGFELKHLFNRIGRDGWGWGVAASIGFDKAAGGGWRRDGFGLTVPYTLRLWDGDAALHLNAGLDKPRDAKREWRWSAALERELLPRTSFFAEAAREGHARLLHGGLRWWLRRERVALDVGVQRVRGGGERESGLVVGLGWYDL